MSSHATSNPRLAASGSLSHNERLLEGEITQFALDMKKLINQKDSADVKFLVGHNKKSIFAHKYILAARCEVFRAMFTDRAGGAGVERTALPGGREAAGTLPAGLGTSLRSDDAPIVIDRLTPDVFLAMLEFIYSNCVTLNSRIALPVLGCANEYGLEELKKLCIRYIVKYLDVTNVCEALQASVDYKLTELRDKALQYIENNAQGVMRSKNFLDLKEEAVCVILDSDELTVDEMELITQIRQWAITNAQQQQGKKPAEVAVEAVKKLRLCLLGPDELQQIEAFNEQDNLLPMTMIAMAWKMHAIKRADRSNPLNRRRKGTVLRESHKLLELV